VPQGGLPTIYGRVVPLGPIVEHELALLFEENAEASDDELARAIIAFAFARRLVMRSTLDPEVIHFPIGRDGESRGVRVADEPPRPDPPRTRRRQAEWTATMPARRLP
jgi:hypothetical protein